MSPSPTRTTTPRFLVFFVLGASLLVAAAPASAQTSGAAVTASAAGDAQDPALRHTASGAEIADADQGDMLMLAIDFGIALLSTFIPGVGCVAPIAQGLVAGLAGEQIAGKEYPMWGAAIVAGYATYAVGIVAIIAVSIFSGLALGVVAGNSSAGVASATLLGYALGLGGWAITALVAEPLVVWWVKGIDSYVLADEYEEDDGYADSRDRDRAVQVTPAMGY